MEEDVQRVCEKHNYWHKCYCITRFSPLFAIAGEQIELSQTENNVRGEGGGER